MAVYETRDSYKVTLYAQVGLASFIPDTLRVCVNTHGSLSDDTWLDIGTVEVDLVKLGFEIPTIAAIQKLSEEAEQRQLNKERQILLNKLKELEHRSTDICKDTQSLDKN